MARIHDLAAAPWVGYAGAERGGGGAASNPCGVPADSRAASPGLRPVMIRGDSPAKARVVQLLCLSAVAGVLGACSWQGSPADTRQARRLQTDEALAGEVASGYDLIQRDVPYVSARDELWRRGTQTIPAIVTVLRRHAARPRLEGLEVAGVWHLLLLLGPWGGPDVTAELRAWLGHETAPPEVRAVAARVLGELGDRDSAPTIARLLAQRTPQWRKVHSLLIRALGALEARDQVPAIRAALVMEDDYERRSFIGGSLIREGTGALARLGTPEAWAVVEAMAADQAWGTRMWVYDTLGGVEPAAAIPLLLRGLDDPDTKVRETACGAILNPGPALTPRFLELRSQLGPPGGGDLCRSEGEHAAYWWDRNVRAMRAWFAEHPPGGAARPPSR